MPDTISKTRYVIAVPDLAASAKFYQEALGYEIHEISDAGWRFFLKDHCCIMAGECPDAIPPGQLGDHAYFAYMVIDGIDSYHKKVVAAGAEIVKPLRDEPWEMREFGVRTQDGHRIMFGSPT